MPGKLLSIFALVLAAAAGAGCAAKTSVQPFPQSWPQPLEPPAPGAAATRIPSAKLGADPAEGTPAQPSGPPVRVAPLVIEQAPGQAAGPAGGQPTSEVLTSVLISKLRAAGVNVASGGADYRLEGVVPWIGTSARAGYPKRLTYQSALAYRLVDERTGRVVMQRQVEHAVEQSVLVNTMSRLPSPEYAHDQQVLERAITPTWETAASGVQGFLKGTQERAEAAK